MAPTMETQSGESSDSDYISDSTSKRSTWEPSDVAVYSQDFSNTCETYFGNKDGIHISRSAVPEASSVFREALDTMNLERSQGICKITNTVNDKDTGSSQTITSSSPSFLTKLKSAFKSSPSSSPHLSPKRSQGLPFLSTSTSKTSTSRRPASFGGSDVVKPNTERRSSNCEKRVSWADERGSDHPLFSVRLIRPRLSTDPNPGAIGTPGISILRNTGIF